jgi:hypothetical protein
VNGHEVRLETLEQEFKNMKPMIENIKDEYFRVVSDENTTDLKPSIMPLTMQPMLKSIVLDLLRKRLFSKKLITTPMVVAFG